MTQHADLIERLAACPHCGAECSVQVFSGSHIIGAVTVWACSRSRMLGGDCITEQSYLSAAAWNEAAALLEALPLGDVEESEDPEDKADRLAKEWVKDRGDAPYAGIARSVIRFTLGLPAMGRPHLKAPEDTPNEQA